MKSLEAQGQTWASWRNRTTGGYVILGRLSLHQVIGPAIAEAPFGIKLSHRTWDLEHSMNGLICRRHSEDSPPNLVR